MADENLESRVGKTKISFKCGHRKADDFTYHHYDKDNIQVEAYSCLNCLPHYYGMIKGIYQGINEKNTPQDDDDGFDENTMHFKDPE